MKDHYATLGIPRDFSPDQIDRAWRSAVLRTHPDRGGRREDFEAARTAYDVLRHPELRRKYDRGEQVVVQDPFRGSEAEIALILGLTLIRVVAPIVGSLLKARLAKRAPEPPAIRPHRIQRRTARGRRDA